MAELRERLIAAWRRHPRRNRLIRTGVLLIAVIGIIGTLVVSCTGLGVRRSGVVNGKQPHPGVNILVMGLDSRLDERGKPLPKEMYKALHTGDEKNGGMNANVLMLMHLPGDGRPASVLSIPRDDWVDVPGCPDQECKAKIKEAYGLAYDQETRRLSAAGVRGDELEQRGRDAGRRSEIATVEAFLGAGVHIDHFVEVTMIAFYQIAQQVQPITVCVINDTQDSYSGAKFRAGRQEIDASQAIAFVRQRRDTAHPGIDFTELDRERRQQAFIISLAHKLESTGTLANPAKVTGILNVARNNLAMDAGLDQLDLIRQADTLVKRHATFYTSPVERYGTNERGQFVNFVDLGKVRALAAKILELPVPTAAPETSAAPTLAPSPTPSPRGKAQTRRTPTPTPTPSPQSSTLAPPVPIGNGAPPPADELQVTSLSDQASGGIPCVK